MKLPEWMKKKWKAVSTGEIVTLVIGFFLFALLAPLALTAVEAYTPTDPTLVIIWPIVAVLFLIGVAIRYIPRRA
jgi:hypothetical protein